MKHASLPIFIPHNGCPAQCSFCNQRTISGAQTQPSPEDAAALCREAMGVIPEGSQIAFFGGSFTAIPRDYMLSLLDAVQPFIKSEAFSGIRISTRPDYIDEECLDILKRKNVHAIELGAQSLNDNVLMLNKRGHDADAVRKASKLIKANGFELGLQLMQGLYGATPSIDRESAYEALELLPDAIRLYPVVILEGTELAQLFRSGEYRPYPFDDVVELCAELLLECHLRGVTVLRCGLHSSENVQESAIGGYYHPAFAELCQTLCYRRLICTELDRLGAPKELDVHVAPNCISKAIGHKRSNLRYFSGEDNDTYHVRLRFVPDSNVSIYECRCEINIAGK